MLTTSVSRLVNKSVLKNVAAYGAVRARHMASVNDSTIRQMPQPKQQGTPRSKERATFTIKVIITFGFTILGTPH